MKLHWPVPSAVHSTASHRANHPTVMKPFRAGLALLATGSLIFGGNLPAALAQAPHEDATQTDQAEAATPASPFSVPTNAGSPQGAPRNAAPGSLPQQKFDQFIVTYTDDAKQRAEERSGDAEVAGGVTPGDLDSGIQQTIDSSAASLETSGGVVRTTTSNDAIVQTSKKLDKQQAQEFMDRLASNPNVASVEPDYVNYPAVESTFVFNDPLYSKQWNLTNPTVGIGNTGNARLYRGLKTTVAVIDTGYTRHPELIHSLVPGYDFISNPVSGRDGNGRDADPTDEGDQAPFNLCGDMQDAQISTWHGTHVAGIIAARGQNRQGIAGVSDLAAIQPIRVLGRCGGQTSDIADAIMWAAGGHINGVPDNKHPAQIINLSLGGVRACPNAYQKAINFALSRGAIVVAAAGNAGIDASQFAPANCKGVIAVGNSTKNGTRASDSNYGKTVTVSAPGTDILSLGIDSINRPNGKYNYVYRSGTSMAAPHVSGILAQQFVNGANVSRQKVYSSAFNAAANPIKCDKGYCGRGIISSRKIAQYVGNLDAQGKMSFSRPRTIYTSRVITSAHRTALSDIDAQDTSVEVQGGQAPDSAEEPATMTNDNAEAINPDAVSADADSSEESGTQSQEANDLSDDGDSQQDGDYTMTSPVQKPREAGELTLVS